MGLEVFLVIVCLVVVALAAVGATARCSSAARHWEALSSWEKGWLSPSSLIEESDSAFGNGKSLSGTWTGSFSYNDILKSSVKLEDGQFTAELSQEGKVIAGHISDALGEASILGVIEYPDVRFAKSYDASNSTSWRVGSHLGKIYYEGRVSADGESMTGE